MLNLIVYCFFQFLSKIMNFSILISIFMAWNLLDSENFAWIFTRGACIHFSWVPIGSKLTLKSKTCGKNHKKCDLYINFLNYSQESKIDHVMTLRGSNIALRKLKRWPFHKKIDTKMVTRFQSLKVNPILKIKDSKLWRIQNNDTSTNRITGCW